MTGYVYGASRRPTLSEEEWAAYELANAESNYMYQEWNRTIDERYDHSTAPKA